MVIKEKQRRCDKTYVIKRWNRAGKISNLPLTHDGYDYGSDEMYENEIDEMLEEISSELNIDFSNLAVFEKQITYELIPWHKKVKKDHNGKTDSR